MAALFSPFRALGYITDSVPFCTTRMGKETFVTVSVGRAWQARTQLLSHLNLSANIPDQPPLISTQVYNSAKLTLVLVGPQMKDTIRALATKKDLTLSAVGPDIIACKRAHLIGTYPCPFPSKLGRPQGNILSLLVLGDQLLSLTSNGYLVNWSLEEYSSHPLVMDLGSSCPGGGLSFGRPTCMAHPDTYINKVLVGGDKGQVQLWNFMTGQLIYTFEGWGSGVRSLAPSPALDVIAAGERRSLSYLRRSLSYRI